MVDAETKEPLVGAVVLVHWNVTALVPGHPENLLDAEEALTDSQGGFVVGKNPPRSWIPGTQVSLPDITIFQPGYGFFPEQHTSPPWPPTGYKGLLKVMQEDGVVIELPRLKTREERIRVIRRVNPLVVPREKMPNFVRLLNIERKSLYLPPAYGER